jgi:hypothetical protein
MRKRQSKKKTKKYLKNKDKPPDVIYLAFYKNHDRKIYLNQKVIIHFLTKCFAPKLAGELQNKNWLLKKNRKGRKFAHYEDKENIIVEIEKQESDLAMIVKVQNFQEMQVYLEKKHYLDGLKSGSNMKRKC